MSHFVSDVFNEKPQQWGLRGDPLFWDYMKKYYSTTMLPYPVDKLYLDIIKEFKQLTGFLPENDKSFLAKRFSTKRIGMSTGFLSGDFWLVKAIPLLEDRLIEANLNVEVKI